MIAMGGIGRVFKYRNYRLFWTGQVIGNVGVWIYRLATAWLAWDLTHSTAWLGVVASGAMVPSLVLGPLAGTTSDRYGHRRQLLTSQSVTCLTAFVAGVLSLTGLMTIELLFALALVQGSARSFNVPARNAFVPSLVPVGDVSAAIGINSATYQGGNFVGPALGGILIASFGVTTCFFFYSVGVAVAWTMLAIIRVAPRPKREGRKRSLIGDLTDGLRYTASHKSIRAIILMSTVSALMIAPFQEMLAGVSDLVFQRGATGLATLASSAGLGAMVGGLWIAWRGRTEGLIRIQIRAVATAITALLVFSLSHFFWLTAAACSVIACCMVTSSTSGDSLTQSAVDPQMRARVTAVQAMIAVGFPSAGSLLIGWAGTKVGIQLPFTVAAVLAFAAWFICSRILWRQRDALERPREAAILPN